MTDTTRLDRRTMLVALGAGLAAPALAGRAVAQPAWPSQPIRMIAPFPAGGSVDVLTRILGERLKEKLGGNWVVENRPGAGGNIGIDAVVRAEPDGHTIGSATVGHFAINQYLYAKMAWDPDRDLAPISMAWNLPNVAVVPAQHNPSKTLAEFIAWAKARPDGVFYGSPGVGTTPHLSAALFVARHGLKATHVPFRGAASIIPAMLKGEIHFAIDNLASYMGIISGGEIRPLAVTSDTRWPTLPDVPTMAEAGTPDFVVTSWGALVAPKAMPRPIIDRIAAAMAEIAQDPTVIDRFSKAGAMPLSSTPEEVVARGKGERAMWQETIRISGARIE